MPRFQPAAPDRPLRRDTLAPRALLAAALLGPALIGCASDGPEGAPEASVYHAHSAPEIRAHMRVLADELLSLTELTVDGASDDGRVRGDVLASLERIDARARRVGGDGAVTNYSVVNDNMDAFLDDVALARDFAAREPANLVPANRLVQSCLSCHDQL